MLWRKEVFKKSNMGFLIWMGAAIAIASTGWRVIMNNFAVEIVGMSGDTIGILQSLREVPGLLAFTALIWLMFLKEQRMAILSLAMLGVGVSITGFIPTLYGFYFSTVIMSIGFHYLEVLNSSLTTQFFTSKEFNGVMSQLKSASSFFSILGFGVILLLLNVATASYATIFFVSGSIAIVISLYLATFKQMKTTTAAQKNRVIIKKKYSLYYALIFLSGARRQIFVVFAGFLMVDRFGFSASNMAILFFTSHLVTVFFAPYIGKVVTKIGAKNSLVLEYSLLTIIFILYAFVNSKTSASVLYILDGLTFSLSIALKSYFKSVAEPSDIAATASVSVTINHIAAVVLPFVLGMIWIKNYQLVFFIGAVFSVASIMVSLCIKEQETATVQNITTNN